jgi:hypothetical protein
VSPCRDGAADPSVPDDAEPYIRETAEPPRRAVIPPPFAYAAIELDDPPRESQ